jgi:glycosyltransferase involved in cell wall biosynthesis
MDVFGGLAAAWAGVPFLVSERSSQGAYPGNWRDRVRCAIGRRAARIAANSEGGRLYWTSLGMEADSIAVIRNGIPFEEIDRYPDGLPEELRLLPDEELIVYAGRLIVEKNLRNLLEAIGIVLEAKPRARAIFFGEGPQKAELVAAVQRGPCGGRVRIHGYTDRIWSILKRANVFVSVSTFEGNPNAVLEAAACRCPLLLSDIPAHREILDGDSAHFVSPASVPQIAAGIARALENSGESRRKAEKAYACVSRYSVESAAQAYLSLYRDVLETARAPRGERK